MKGITITNVFQTLWDESKYKPTKRLIVSSSGFYTRSMKSFLQNNVKEMYSAHNEGKSVIAKRFIGTLKNKSCKYMTLISKNVYIDKLDDIVKIRDIYWV